MTIEEAKKQAQAVITGLTGINPDDVMDDGRDNDNAAQNQRFSKASMSIKYATQKLANIEIDGISSETLDNKWRECAGEHFHSNLPECQHNRALRYANWILSL